MTPAKVKPPGFGFGLISFSVLKSYRCGGVVNLDMELPIVATNCLLLGAHFYLLSSTTMPHEFHQRFMQRKSAEGKKSKTEFQLLHGNYASRRNSQASRKVCGISCLRGKPQLFQKVLCLIDGLLASCL